MLNLPIYNNIKLTLAFEFGVILSDTAKDLGIPLTPELIKRAEKILLNEFRTRTASQIATNFVPLCLAVFETN